MPRELKSAIWPKLDRQVFEFCSSFEEAERGDRAYWHAASLKERMQALELTRQMVFGYGNGRTLPRFQSVLEIVKPREDQVSSDRRLRR